MGRDGGRRLVGKATVKALSRFVVVFLLSFLSVGWLILFGGLAFYLELQELF